MKFSTSLLVVALAAGASASPLNAPRFGKGFPGFGHSGSSATSSAAASSTASASSDPQTSLTLLSSVIATGFENDGQDVPAAGQVPSLTSPNNFINFCATVPSLPLTNGTQIKTGSCNPAPMGVIAASTNMPSSKFVFPANGATIAADTDFTIQMAVRNLATGNFVNAAQNFFAAPQQVDAGSGNIKGHSHVVVELLPSLNSTAPTDPTKFAFFKGLNAEADSDGILTADVGGGRACGRVPPRVDQHCREPPACARLRSRSDGALDDSGVGVRTESNGNLKGEDTREKQSGDIRTETMAEMIVMMTPAMAEMMAFMPPPIAEMMEPCGCAVDEDEDEDEDAEFVKQ
uniref:Siderophore exporter MmpL5 n=1 Tax=Ganoderma boninense TaxID=34458 RepID=A0A5K1JYU8_9APHY|nr:Siderophore exporter MmpL5 [Ganoderma boninense]